MFHLVAWTQNQNSSAGLLPVNVATDATLAFSGSFLTVVQGLNFFAGALAFGATVTRAQLLSPSLRQIFNEELDPVQTVMTNSGWHNIIDKFRAPVPLVPNEQLQAQVSSSAAGEQDTIFAWLADGPILPITGIVHGVRVTATATLTANAWSNAALTFDQTLPSGTYQIVGARFRSTGMVAFRFVFPGGFWRPGGLGRQAATINDDVRFRVGYLGVWGQFPNLVPPTVDFWSTSADTAETGVLDLIKIA